MGFKPEVHAVQDALGYSFKKLEGLRDALTHRSFRNERPRLAPRDNERLEFLGDAVIGWVAANLLYTHFPEANEGELTRRRADLICERSLSAIARELKISEALRLGNGEEKSGGRQKPRLLASAFEACVGAIVRDSALGEEAEQNAHRDAYQDAYQVVARLFLPHLSQENVGMHDYKSRLQERVQAEGTPAPVYHVVQELGPAHDRTFEVIIKIKTAVVAHGRGRSKAEAEQSAAKIALAQQDKQHA